MIKLEVSTRIYATEDQEVIEKMLQTICKFEKFEIVKDKGEKFVEIFGRAEGPQTLEYLFKQVRKQRTVQVVHNHTQEFRNEVTNTCEFMINKQALTQGIISICNHPRESPMGPVYIKLYAENINRLLNYLFPRTEKGKVIEAQYTPTE